MDLHLHAFAFALLKLTSMCSDAQFEYCSVREALLSTTNIYVAYLDMCSRMMPVSYQLGKKTCSAESDRYMAFNWYVFTYTV